MRLHRHSSFTTSCFSVIALLCSVIFYVKNFERICTNCTNPMVNLRTKNLTNVRLHHETLGVNDETNVTSKKSKIRRPYVWTRSGEVCEDLKLAIGSNPILKRNLVCFDFDSKRHVQLYTDLTPRDTSAGPYLDAALTFLLHLFHSAPLQQVKRRFVWALHDDASFESSTAQIILRFPKVIILAHSVKEDFIQYATLVPNFHYIASKGFERLCLEFDNLDLPFAEREKTVFWRGVSTGFDCWHGHKVDACTCKELQRVEAVEVAREVQHLDYGITSGVQMCSSVDLSSVQATRVPEVEWAKRRGLLDVDGNVDAWGSFWRMCSRSLVFKVKSQYASYFSSYFKEDVHFIGLDQDLSDMANKTNLVESDESETLHRMEEIATKAYQVAKQLTYQSVVSNVADLVFK